MTMSLMNGCTHFSQCFKSLMKRTSPYSTRAGQAEQPEGGSVPLPSEHTWCCGSAELDGCAVPLTEHTPLASACRRPAALRGVAVPSSLLLSFTSHLQITPSKL